MCVERLPGSVRSGRGARSNRPSIFIPRLRHSFNYNRQTGGAGWTRRIERQDDRVATAHLPTRGEACWYSRCRNCAYSRRGKLWARRLGG